MNRTVGDSRHTPPGHVSLSCGHEIPSSPRVVGSSADCEACDRRAMPQAVVEGRTTRTFTAESVPAALLSNHRTNAWARLVVTTGSVSFHEDEPPWEATATADEPVVIVPGRGHRIVPSADASFAVQFYDLPSASHEDGP